VSRNWTKDLYSSIRKANIKIVGQDDIKNEAHAKTAIAFIKAFGKSDAGFIYFEPYTTNSTDSPPDIVICHPEIGVMVIEVKGYTIDDIQGIEGGKISIRVRGYNRFIDPFAQASGSMFSIKNATERKLRNQYDAPLFNYMASFPNINEKDWIQRGYRDLYPDKRILFKDHINDRKLLKQKVGALVEESKKKARIDIILKKEHIPIIKSIFGSSDTIKEFRKPRKIENEDLLGAYIDELASLDKYFSAEQNELSRIKVEGFPRLIRGVAGSGKTVVLAEMAARFIKRKLYDQTNLFETKKAKPYIGVICFNRALVSFIKSKISHAFKQQTLEDLPFDTILVTHLNGLMLKLSEMGIVDYISVSKIKNPSERANNYIDQIRWLAKNDPDYYKSILFDAIFVDEAQDFVPEEFMLLLELVKEDKITKEKTIVIFYDDAQNLYVRPRPNWKRIGINVSKGDRTRVMKECFRNTKEIITLAFNILLGSQAPTVKIGNASLKIGTRTFADVNYLKQIGLVEEHEDHYDVNFAERRFREPIIKKFKNREEEISWVSEEIIRLVEEEQVRPEDILVLSPHRNIFENLPVKIAMKQKLGIIKGFIQPYGDNEDKNSYIFREGHLTISTIHGAKGYDAHIVFLIGTETLVFTEKGRASFYVGATRAKTLLYVTGADNNDKFSLLSEAERVSSILFKE